MTTEVKITVVVEEMSNDDYEDLMFNIEAGIKDNGSVISVDVGVGESDE